MRVNVIDFPIKLEHSRTRALSIFVLGKVHIDKGDLSYFVARKMFKDVLDKAIVLCI